MAQDIINIGPQPNDGQGDNLRTAFDKTNDNFDQIWTAGPVGSNVRIAGNVISTLQVNQDLALSPNGTGNIRLNNNTIPGANNTWFLGSATMQWRGVYAASVETGNITITGTLTVPGDAVIQGNLTVEGDTIQIGNIVTDTKTIQLANTAANAIQANGSGITVGASDNIATFLYNSTSNSWVTNLQVTYANGQPIGKTPGGSNTYIQFNDSGNFGGNANFTYNRATGNFYLGGANLRAVAGNSQPYILQVPGIAFQGGSAIMEWDAVNQHVDVSNSLSVNGTLQLYGNYPGAGSLITTSGGSGVDITIEPSGNLYLNADGGEVIVSDQTASINPNTGALKVLGGIGVNGNVNVGGNITGANITANYFVGNGSLLTGITSYANANAVAYGEAGWAGNIVPSGNLVYSLGNATNRWNDLYLAGNTIYLGAANISAVAGNLQTAILSVPGIQFQGGNSVMEWDPTNQHVDVSNSFSISGTLELYGNYPGDGAVIKTPGGSGVDIKIEPSGNLYLNADGGEVIVSDQTPSTTFNDGALIVLGGVGVDGNINAGGNITGNAILGNITGLTGSITNLDSLNFSVENISALVGNNGVNISAGGFNNLVVLPTEVLIQNVPLNTTGNISANYFIGDGSQLTGLPASYGDANVATFLAAYGSNTISTTGNVTAGNFIGAGSNVELVAQTEQWVFDTTGVLTVPGNITGADVVSANTFVSNAFNVVTAGNLSITSQYGLGFTGTILEDNGTLELIANGGGGVVLGWDSTYGNGLGNIATVNFNEVGGEGILLRTGNRAATEYNWNFDSTGNLTLPSAGYLLVQTGIIGAGASPAPTLSGFSSIATTGVQGNISASGNLLAAGYANITGNINGSNATFSGNVTGNTAGYTIGYRDIPQVTFSANATAALTDAGKHYYSTTAGNLSITLPDNSSVAFPTGATLTIVVNAAGNVLVGQGTGVTLYQAGASATGNRVVGAYGLASVMKVAANTWVISGTGVY